MLSIKRQNLNTNLVKYLDASQKAMREISAEKFQSKTLKQFFLDPKFYSQEADTVIVKSKETGEPVKVFVKKTMDLLGDIRSYYYIFFRSKENTTAKDSIAEKFFAVTTRKRFKVLNPKTHPGMMKSKIDDLVGLGIRLDELQIKEAISLGANRIMRASIPSAILYHLKMGFVPNEELVMIKNEADLKKEMRYIIHDLSTIEEQLITPIIVEKEGFWGKKFYIDINNTKAVAFVRKAHQILNECPEKIRMLAMRGEIVDMELSGENLKKWKDAISGNGNFDTMI